MKKSPKDIALMILGKGEPKPEDDMEDKKPEGDNSEEDKDSGSSDFDDLASTAYQSVKDDDEEGFKEALRECIKAIMKE